MSSNERREWIKRHHPDRGGDPVRFVEGLARFDGPARRPAARRVTVHRSRSPWAVVRRTWRRWRRTRLRGRRGRSRRVL